MPGEPHHSKSSQSLTELGEEISAIGFEVDITDERLSAAEWIDRRNGLNVLSGYWFRVVPSQDKFDIIVSVGAPEGSSQSGLDRDEVLTVARNLMVRAAAEAN